MRRLTFIVALIAAFVMVANVNAAYFVQFEPHQHSTFSATLNGTTFYGGVVNIGDELSVTWKSNAGWLFDDNDGTELSMKSALAATDFDSDDVCRINEPGMHQAKPKVMVQLLSKTSAQIMWDNPGGTFSAYRLWVSLDKLSGNPDYWKGTVETDKQTYTATDLFEDETYYVYLQGGDLNGYTSEIVMMEFKTHEPGNPCEYIIEMSDRFGDGWNGNGLLIKEGISETFITLLEGSTGTESYISQGYDVEISWVVGSYADEVSFTIKNGDGIEIMKVNDPNAYYLSDGEVLFSGKICNIPTCASTVSGINWELNADSTEYTITWAGVGAASYEVAVVQKTHMTQADIEAAAKPASTEQFKFAGKPHGIYDVFVRGICADGVKGLWNHIQICDILISKPTDAQIKSYSKNITLDYEEKADLTATAYANGPSASELYPIVIYHLVVADSMDVEFVFNPFEYMSYGFILFRDTLAGAPLDLFTGFSSNEVVRMKGDYYIVLQTEKLGEYSLCIQKRKELVATPVTLPFEKSGAFVDAPFYSAPTMPYGKCVAYKFTPTDTVDVMISTFTNNSYGGVGLNVYQRVISDKTQKISIPGGGTEIMTFLKDTTYYLVLLSIPDYGGSPETDTFAIKAKIIPAAPVPTPVETITMDYVSKVSFDEDDYIPEAYMTGKVFRYVPEKDMQVSISIELLGDKADDQMLQQYLGIVINKDSLTGDRVTDAWANYTYGELTPELKQGIPYYFVVGSRSNLSMTGYVSIRELPNWDVVVASASSIEVGQRQELALNYSDDPLTNEGAYANNYGSYRAYKVHLEKDQSYKIISHALYEYSNETYNDRSYEVTVFNPAVTTGSFEDRRLTYSNSVYDGWNVINLTASETADYTIIVGAPLDLKWREDYFVIEFAVEPVQDIEEVINAAPQITALPYVKEGQFVNNVMATTNSSLYFHRNASSFIEELGAYNVEACRVEVMPGDTLFFEFGGDEDAMIHIYNNALPIDDKNPIIVDEVHYAFPYEKGFVVNEDIDPVKFTIVGSFANVELEKGLSYTFRVSTKGADLEPAVVTAVASKTSIQVKEDATTEEIMMALAGVTVSALDKDGKTLFGIDVLPHLWTLDLTTNTAQYELSNIDLPVGYTFATPKVWIKVAIEWIPTSIEAVEQVAPAAPRKVIREGRILILTPNGTFDMFGRRVE